MARLRSSVHDSQAKPLAWTYTYHPDGELNQVTNPDTEVTAHDDLTDGRLKSIALANAATREFFYQDTDASHAYVANKNSHLRKTLDIDKFEDPICSFDYELDAAGIRRGITDYDGKYRAYGYDPRYQLKSEMHWSSKTPGSRANTLLWALDGNGNRITQHENGSVTKYVTGDNNEMLEAGDEEFTFDYFGNTSEIVGSEEFGYDFEGHMLQRTVNESIADVHEYDGNGRRMRSRLDNAANWTNFIHDELTENVLCEYTLITGTYTVKAVNTYGLGLISTNREGTKRYFHFDGLGSTMHLTDASCAVTDSYTFDAYGNPLSSSGSSVNPYRYVGQWGYYNDGAMGSSSGMLLLGVRHYWPRYGRFTTWDVFASDSAYVYCDNSPTRLIDPSGHVPELVGCSAAQRRLILSHLADICDNRIQYIPSLHIRRCLRRRCTNVVIYCNPALCNVYGNICGFVGSGSWTPGDLVTRINICPAGWSSRCGCLGRTILHEMVHSCGHPHDVPYLCEYAAFDPGLGRPGCPGGAP